MSTIRAAAVACVLVAAAAGLAVLDPALGAGVFAGAGVAVGVLAARGRTKNDDVGEVLRAAFPAAAKETDEAFLSTREFEAPKAEPEPRRDGRVKLATARYMGLDDDETAS